MEDTKLNHFESDHCKFNGVTKYRNYEAVVSFMLFNVYLIG